MESKTPCGCILKIAKVFLHPNSSQEKTTETIGRIFLEPSLYLITKIRAKSYLRGITQSKSLFVVGSASLM